MNQYTAVLCTVRAELLIFRILEESEAQKELGSSYESEASLESKLQSCGQWQVSCATEEDMQCQESAEEMAEQRPWDKP